MTTGGNTLNSRLTPRLWQPDVSGRADGWLSSSPEAPPATWLIHRRLTAKIAVDLFPLLTLEEGERYSRLHRQEDRDCFLLGRGVLRLLLAEILGCSPTAVRFDCTPYGKPILDQTFAVSSLQFNCAHSEDLVLLGFHSCRSVGIDLERHGAEFEWLPVAQQYFPPHVCNEINVLDQSEKLPAFYHQWCRLEAGLKAQGMGFSLYTDPVAHPLVMAGIERYDLLLPQDYSGSVAVV